MPSLPTPPPIRAHACSHLLACLLAFASMSSLFCPTCATGLLLCQPCPVLVNAPTILADRQTHDLENSPPRWAPAPRHRAAEEVRGHV